MVLGFLFTLMAIYLVILSKRTKNYIYYIDKIIIKNIDSKAKM